FFFSSRRRHTRFSRDWSSDVCSSDLTASGDIAVKENCSSWSAHELNSTVVNIAIINFFIAYNLKVCINSDCKCAWLRHIEGVHAEKPRIHIVANLRIPSWIITNQEEVISLQECP